MFRKWTSAYNRCFYVISALLYMAIHSWYLFRRTCSDTTAIFLTVKKMAYPSKHFHIYSWNKILIFQQIDLGWCQYQSYEKRPWQMSVWKNLYYFKHYDQQVPICLYVTVCWITYFFTFWQYHDGLILFYLFLFFKLSEIVWLLFPHLRYNLTNIGNSSFFFKAMHFKH